MFRILNKGGKMKFNEYISEIKFKEGHGCLTAFADRIGITLQALGRLRTGKVTHPRLDMLQKIKRATGGKVSDVDDFDFFPERN